MLLKMNWLCHGSNIVQNCIVKVFTSPKIIHVVCGLMLEFSFNPHQGVGSSRPYLDHTNFEEFTFWTSVVHTNAFNIINVVDCVINQ